MVLQHYYKLYQSERGDDVLNVVVVLNTVDEVSFIHVYPITARLPLSISYMNCHSRIWRLISKPIRSRDTWIWLLILKACNWSALLEFSSSFYWYTLNTIASQDQFHPVLRLHRRLEEKLGNLSCISVMFVRNVSWEKVIWADTCQHIVDGVRVDDLSVCDIRFYGTWNSFINREKKAMLCYMRETVSDGNITRRIWQSSL